jgi:hypothetical protein
VAFPWPAITGSLREMAAIRGKQPWGHASMPCNSQDNRKTAGQTYLTPARSFRDDLVGDTGIEPVTSSV